MRETMPSILRAFHLKCIDNARSMTKILWDVRGGGGGRKVCVLVYHSSMGRGWFREQGVKMHPGFNIQYSNLAH